MCSNLYEYLLCIASTVSVPLLDVLIVLYASGALERTSVPGTTILTSQHFVRRSVLSLRKDLVLSIYYPDGESFTYYRPVQVEYDAMKI